MNKIQYAVAATMLVMASIPGFACAQDTWPSKAITYVVPFPAGSNTDVLGRIIADELGK